MAHGASTARAGTPEPEHQERSRLSWETTLEGPPGQAGLQGPQLAQGSWALQRMDEHPSAVMPTDSSPPMDTLDICTAWGQRQPARSSGVLQGLVGKGDMQVTPGSPAARRHHSLMFTCSKGKG